METERQVIETIERRTRELVTARDTLIREFGLSRQTRRELVVSYLESHGPTSAANLIRQTQTPRGTLGGILADKNFFVRAQDGKWDLAP